MNPIANILINIFDQQFKVIVNYKLAFELW